MSTTTYKLLTSAMLMYLIYGSFSNYSGRSLEISSDKPISTMVSEGIQLDVSASSGDSLVLVKQELDAARTDIAILKQQVHNLSSYLAAIGDKGKEVDARRNDVGSPRSSAALSNFVPVQARYETLSYDVLSENDNGDVMNHAIYSHLDPNMQLITSECRGSLCKLYHMADESGYDPSVDDDFSSRLAETVGGNISLYFDDENGQKVMYVEVRE